jgi:hypothetical protein
MLTMTICVSVAYANSSHETDKALIIQQPGEYNFEYNYIPCITEYCFVQESTALNVFTVPQDGLTIYNHRIFAKNHSKVRCCGCNTNFNAQYGEQNEYRLKIHVRCCGYDYISNNSNSHKRGHCQHNNYS